jgi:hypothetical protein
MGLFVQMCHRYFSLLTGKPASVRRDSPVLGLQGNSSAAREVCMAEEQGGEKPLPKLTIRLVGFQPGASQDELALALGRLYKGRSQEEIRKALARVPFTLSRSATEEQARKIRGFLETKGALLEITYQAVLKAQTFPVEEKGELQELKAPGALSPVGKPIIWAKERRSKPRVHPGLPLEPMGLKEILCRALVLLRENLVLFFLLMLLPNLISFLLARLLGGVEGMGFSPASLGSPEILVLAVGVLVFVVLFIWTEGALIYAVSEIHLGHEAGLWGSLGAVLPKLGALLSTMLLVWFLIFLGFLCFVIPGVIFLLRWLMADKVVVLEGLRGTQAMRRSRELMRFRFGAGFWSRPWARVSLLGCGVGLVCLGMYLVLLIPGWILSYFFPGALSSYLGEGLELLAETLTSAYGSIALVIYYYDTRVRKENFDHRSMAEHV